MACYCTMSFRAAEARRARKPYTSQTLKLIQMLRLELLQGGSKGPQREVIGRH